MTGRRTTAMTCGARLTWAAEIAGGAIAYVAQCPQCGTVHAANDLPAPTAARNWCSCSIEVDRPVPVATVPRRSGDGELVGAVLTAGAPSGGQFRLVNRAADLSPGGDLSWR